MRGINWHFCPQIDSRFREPEGRFGGCRATSMRHIRSDRFWPFSLLVKRRFDHLEIQTGGKSRLIWLRLVILVITHHLCASREPGELSCGRRGTVVRRISSRRFEDSLNHKAYLASFGNFRCASDDITLITYDNTSLRCLPRFFSNASFEGNAVRAGAPR